MHQSIHINVTLEWYQETRFQTEKEQIGKVWLETTGYTLTQNRMVAWLHRPWGLHQHATLGLQQQAPARLVKGATWPQGSAGRSDCSSSDNPPSLLVKLWNVGQMVKYQWRKAVKTYFARSFWGIDKVATWPIFPSVIQIDSHLSSASSYVKCQMGKFMFMWVVIFQEIWSWRMHCHLILR